ncbi:MAG: hypothetical protein Q9221_001577 [Calogaya cf. arnoldii]
MPQPQSAVSHRPQTSRQAKRAYQKAGATPRISAVEQSRIDRAAELQDRAARIRLHNVRARENKRKKAEKDEKDRELRKRMGIPEPSKFSIGPSQLSLGAFVAGGLKQKKLEPIKDEMPECSSPYTPTESINPGEANADCPNVPGLPECPEGIMRETPVVPSELLECCSTSQQKVGPQTSSLSQNLKNTIVVPSPKLMPPPPLPRRMSPKPSQLVPAPTGSTEPSKPVDAAAATESDWDMFLDSNTQVEREISCQPASPPMPAADQRPISATTSQPFGTPADLLDGISTQDLQYCSSPLTSKSDSDNDAEFLEGIEDKDLSDLNVAAFFDCCDGIETEVTAPPSSQRKQSTAAPLNERWTTIDGVKCIDFATVPRCKNINSFNRIDDFDDFEFSSQELRQLVV